MFLILGLFVALFLLLCYQQRKPKFFPPGPPRLPIVGSLPFIVKYPSLFVRLTELTQIYGDICGFYLGSKPIVILGELELIKKVYKMEEASLRPGGIIHTVRYSDKNGYGAKGLIFSSGEEWKEQRRFALRHLRDFGFGKSSMEQLIQREATKLCKSILEEGSLPTQLDYKLNVSIINSLWVILVGEELSMDNPDHKKVIDSVNTLVRSSGRINSPIGQTFPILMSLFPNYFLKTIKEVIDNVNELTAPYRQEHRQTLDEDNLRDYLDVHISAQRSAQPGSSFYGKAGEQHEMISIIDLFIAGAETTSTTITWGILYLLHHPEVQERIHAELDAVVGDRMPSLKDEAGLPYLGAVINEVQRCASLGFAGIPHHTDTDIDVNGYVIPAGSTIFANILQVMHNPAVFEEPDLFNPDRFLDSNGKLKTSPHLIPFLVGKRVCLGSSLAEKELYLFLSQLLHTFTFHPVPGHKLPSYSIYCRDYETSNSVIRFCPEYKLIARERRM